MKIAPTTYLLIILGKIEEMKYLFFVFTFTIGFTSLGQKSTTPRLVVGIVVDQMCYEYLYRFYDKYSEGGFKRLMSGGTNCRNTLYNFIPTYTGPGHASIYTGTTPNNHGIVANDWYDRDTKREINCVEDSSVHSIGVVSDYGKFSPLNLKANTITDQLKLTYPDAKVVSISIKNRGAILPGGHLSDGSYWFDFNSGDFITSSFYTEKLPNWVNKFNEEKHVDKLMKGKWETYYPIDTYTESGEDNSPYEVLLPGKTQPIFPYDMDMMRNSIMKLTQFVHTPFANTFLTDFAIEAICSESLGKDDQSDILAISYSTPDIIGHAFGPYSKEIEDTYIRLDLELKRLLETLDEKIGKKEYTLFLTADHAVVPVPQQLVDKGLPGGYLFLDQYLPDLREQLISKFGADLIESHMNLNIYLNNNLIAMKELDQTEIKSFIMDEVAKWEGVKRVFDSKQLYNTSADDEWKDMVRKGYYPKKSGDIMYILKPGYLPKSTDIESSHKGTSHGSAYSYDTHVPLLWYGKRIPVVEDYTRLEITDITPTLAHLLNLQLPNAVTGKPIQRILCK